jgi:multiple antibiotic resistance protein
VSLPEYILLAASSLFVIVDPLATAPAFLAMTATDTPEARLRTARIACFTMAAVLLVFSVAGTVVFKIFWHHDGGVPDRGEHRAAADRAGHAAGAAFAGAGDAGGNAGGHGKDGHRHHAAGHPDARGAGRDLHDHPAAERGEDHPAHIALYGCILLVALASYLVFRLAVRGARWLNPIAMSIAIRVMGLLLAAVAVQFMLNAIREFHATLNVPPPT